MEAVRFVSKHINFNRYKRLLLVLTIFLVILNLICIFEVIKPSESYHCVYDVIFPNYNILRFPDVRRVIDQFLAQMLIWAVICLWIYAAPRFVEGHAKLKEYLFEITGVPEQPCKDMPADYIEEARELWEHQELWTCTRPQSITKEGAGVIFVKLIYIICWIIIISVAYGIPILQNYIPIRDKYFLSSTNCFLIKTLPYFTLFLGILSLLLSMFSWWSCIEYGYFLSKVSKLRSITAPYGYTQIVKKHVWNGSWIKALWKHKERSKEDYELYRRSDLKIKIEEDQKNYYFNPLHPSQTHGLVRMMHDSSMTSLIFFVISGIFTLQYLCCVWAEQIRISTSFRETIWMLVVLVPGLFSSLPVVIFPKLFILRILRIWRMKLIKEYETNLHYLFACKTDVSKKSLRFFIFHLERESLQDRELRQKRELRQEREYWTKMIDEVEKDRIDVRNYEIIGAILSVLLQVGAIFTTLAAK